MSDVLKETQDEARRQDRLDKGEIPYWRADAGLAANALEAAAAEIERLRAEAERLRAALLHVIEAHRDVSPEDVISARLRGEMTEIGCALEAAEAALSGGGEGERR